MIRIAFSALVALSIVTPAAAAPDGAKLFALQCKACHTQSAVGPNLNGVAGRKIATTNFAYSPALKSKGGIWTDADLDAFLKRPAAFAPGTIMPVSVPNAQDRAALIAYLKTLNP